MGVATRCTQVQCSTIQNIHTEVSQVTFESSLTKWEAIDKLLMKETLDFKALIQILEIWIKKKKNRNPDAWSKN